MASVKASVRAPKKSPFAARLRRAIGFIRDNWNEAQRGACYCNGMLLVFGNDGYSKAEWVSKYVELFRERVKELGFRERNFAIDTKGDSWGVLLSPTYDFANQNQPPNILSPEGRAQVNCLLWECYSETRFGKSGPEGHQRNNVDAQHIISSLITGAVISA